MRPTKSTAALLQGPTQNVFVPEVSLNRPLRDQKLDGLDDRFIVTFTQARIGTWSNAIISSAVPQLVILHSTGACAKVEYGCKGCCGLVGAVGGSRAMKRAVCNPIAGGHLYRAPLLECFAGKHPHLPVTEKSPQAGLLSGGGGV